LFDDSGDAWFKKTFIEMFGVSDVTLDKGNHTISFDIASVSFQSEEEATFWFMTIDSVLTRFEKDYD
jgi:hypothetical protein